MKLRTQTRLQILLSSVLLLRCFAQTQASGRYFLYPLQSENVREAYFLGHTPGSSRLAEFLSRYIRTFPQSSSPLYVQSIEFRTPFNLVVQHKLEQQFTYSAQDAQKDYAALPDRLIVRTIIGFTPGRQPIVSPITGLSIDGPLPGTDTQAPGQSLDTWHGFHFKVAQEKTVEPKRLTSANLTPPGPGITTEVWAVDLAFDAAQFASGTATVEVTSPDGKTLHADFDLDKLK